MTGVTAARALLLGLLALPSVARGQDTLTVRADNPPVLGDDLTLVEELRIGRLEGADEYVFGTVSDIELAENGRIYVADHQVPVVRVYDGDGSFLSDIGREGEGPGEFRGIGDIVLRADGTLVVWDPWLRRVSEFSASGRFIDSFTIPTNTVFAAVQGVSVLASDTSGHLYVKVIRDSPMWNPDLEETTFTWLKYTAGGEFVDSVHPPGRRLEGIVGGPGTRSGSRASFRMHTVSALAPDGELVWGRTRTYALHRRLPDGRIVRIERTVPPVEVRPEERQQWRRFVAEWDRRWGRESPDVPREKVPFRSFSVDRQGRIWVERTAEAELEPELMDRPGDESGFPKIEWYEPSDYDLLSPQGSFLGSVTLPPGLQFVSARGDRVWGVLTGELGEEYAAFYRLVDNAFGSNTHPQHDVRE